MGSCREQILDPVWSWGLLWGCLLKILTAGNWGKQTVLPRVGGPHRISQQPGMSRCSPKWARSPSAWGPSLWDTGFSLKKHQSILSLELALTLPIWRHFSLQHHTGQFFICRVYPVCVRDTKWLCFSGGVWLIPRPQVHAALRSFGEGYRQNPYASFFAHLLIPSNSLQWNSPSICTSRRWLYFKFLVRGISFRKKFSF